VQAVTGEEDVKTDDSIISPPAPAVATAYGAGKNLRFHFQPEDFKQPLVEKIATVLILIATSSWLLVFATCKVAAMAAPWCVVLSAVSIIALVQMLSRRRQDSLTLLAFGGQTPTSLRQTIALSYALFSLAMCVWMVLHRDIEFKHPLLTTRQIIDIELVSDKDFKDNHNILPGTVEKETIKERSASAEVTAQSPQPLMAHKAPTAPAAIHVTHTPNPSENRPMPAKPAKIDSTADIFPMRISEAPRATAIAVKAQSQPTRTTTEQPMLEEVAPAEMVEMTENAGDKGNESYQAGGRSSGGTGAPAPISAYLKELHRRIKHAWTPPTGDTRSAEVLFRIKHNGTLVSIKIVQSSGDETIDESALRAISACSPFKALPADFSPQFLDLQYTFNYTVDSLPELNNRQTF
jgi:TonB family protein